MSLETILSGFLASGIAGMATAVGAALVFTLHSRMSERLEDGLLSLAAGIMLAASVFSLLLPGMEVARSSGASEFGAAMQVVAGMFGGMLLLSLLHCCLPHEHFVAGLQGPEGHKVRRMWLFVIAIAIHNVPEGMAVGVGWGAGGEEQGLALVLGIGAQNIPEGLAVAAALLAIRYSAWRAFLISVLTGLLEAVGGLFGASLTVISNQALPAVLGLAGGAMLFIISDEIIPETHHRGHQALATWSLMVGFCAMMLLDAGVTQWGG
jgi:ZIP family zinc transporter